MSSQPKKEIIYVPTDSSPYQDTSMRCFSLLEPDVSQIVALLCHFGL